MKLAQLQLDQDGAWLHPVNRLSSPNADARPSDANITLAVIHGISLPPGCYGGGEIQQFFCNTLDYGAHEYFQSLRALRVSAHLLIGRQGDLTQFVSFRRRAWHAGVSSYQGLDHCNDYSIGIELEGTDHEPYMEDQYQALGRVLSLLTWTYPHITRDRIVGHSDIAPGRKTDPGAAFDWQHLNAVLNEC